MASESNIRRVGRWEPRQRAMAVGLESAVPEFADGLRQCNFTEDSIPYLVGADSIDDLLSNSMLYAFSTADEVDDLCQTPAGMLTQLFVRNGDVPFELYRNVLPEPVRNSIEILGLVETEGQLALPCVSISPFQGMYFLSDSLFSCAGDEGNIPIASEISGFVMPPHATSLLFFEHIARTNGRLLDVGCGSGVLGMALFRNHTSITGIDINPRAVAYAQINASLNGLDIGFFVNDFLVAPPLDARPEHVIFSCPDMPGHRADVRETGGMSAREVMIRSLRSLRDIVLPGGLAQLLLSVSVPEGYDTPAEVVSEWVESANVEIADFALTELASSTLAIPASVMAQGRLRPGSQLANDREDEELLFKHFRRTGIWSYIPVVVSVTI
jgi:SAM-dependent methyltransferase